ncbi:MAG: hypothetical protein KKB51_23235 [Candidatus Riflebacteria bacterium]|nr:hypothetical protein [Candidatus Riflebacteria bacterium]
MNNRISTIALLLLFFVITASASQGAVTITNWQNTVNLGVSKSDIIKILGKPDNSDTSTDMDTYLISDSPDLMMMGIVTYQSNKAVAAFAVLQPTVLYTKVRDIQLQNKELKLASENNSGVLFAYVTPQANGAKYIAVSNPEDNTTGPMLIEATFDPFQDSPASPKAEPVQKVTKKPVPKKVKIDTSVMMLDIFDWNMPNANGNPKSDADRLAIIKKIKQIWRATGAETDKNAVPAQTILDKMVLGDQANIFESACEAAGIDPAPFWKLRDSQ